MGTQPGARGDGGALGRAPDTGFSPRSRGGACLVQRTERGAGSPPCATDAPAQPDAYAGADLYASPADRDADHAAYEHLSPTYDLRAPGDAYLSAAIADGDLHGAAGGADRHGLALGQPDPDGDAHPVPHRDRNKDGDALPHPSRLYLAAPARHGHPSAAGGHGGTDMRRLRTSPMAHDDPHGRDGHLAAARR